MFGQCSPELISKIKSSDSFANADLDQDVVQLLLICERILLLIW